MTTTIPALVAVDGIDGSGKSVLGRRVTDALAAGGVASVLLRVDDFRRKLDWRAGKAEHDQYYDDYYDLSRLAACVDAAREGARTISVPSWDPAAEAPSPPRTIPVSDLGAVVIEGVFTLRIPAVAADGLVICLRVSEAEARRRILARDLARGRTESEIMRRIECRYFPAQRRYQADCTPAERADVIIDNENFSQPRICRRDLSPLSLPVRSALARIL
ncbi:MAG TPA: hypothetical protein VFG83_00015 [Kofleriaceae bacterium]|nr:hypothetical protein [Kofleriaceae bacterium]